MPTVLVIDGCSSAAILMVILVSSARNRWSVMMNFIESALVVVVVWMVVMAMTMTVRMAATVFNVLASRWVTSRRWFIQHLRFVKLLIMLSDSIGVHRANMAARTAYVGRMLVSELARVMLIINLRRPLCTTVLVWRVIAATVALLLLLPGRWSIVYLILMLLFVIIVIHCGRGKNNLSFNSWRHIRVDQWSDWLVTKIIVIKLIIALLIYLSWLILYFLN